MPNRRDRFAIFLTGYTSVLRLYQQLTNPARMTARYLGKRGGDDFLPIALDWAQTNEDLKVAFNHVAEGFHSS